jgi:hypothetical protein
VPRLSRISSRVLQCSQPLQGQLQKEKRKEATGVANRGDLGSENFSLLQDDDFEETTQCDIIIVSSFSESPRPPMNRRAE